MEPIASYTINFRNPLEASAYKGLVAFLTEVNKDFTPDEADDLVRDEMNLIPFTMDDIILEAIRYIGRAGAESMGVSPTVKEDFDKRLRYRRFMTAYEGVTLDEEGCVKEEYLTEEDLAEMAEMED